MKFKDGDIYSKLEWENSDGERFIARPFSLLFAGHWFNKSYVEYCWDFDHLAKFDKLLAQIWNDAHDENDHYFYYYDIEHYCFKFF